MAKSPEETPGTISPAPRQGAQRALQDEPLLSEGDLMLASGPFLLCLSYRSASAMGAPFILFECAVFSGLPACLCFHLSFCHLANSSQPPGHGKQPLFLDPQYLTTILGLLTLHENCLRNCLFPSCHHLLAILFIVLFILGL